MLHRGASSIWNLGTSAVEVVVIGNSRKLSLCACQVLQRLLQKKTQLNTLVVTDATEMKQAVLTSQPLYLVVILSRGLLQEKSGCHSNVCGKGSVDEKLVTVRLAIQTRAVMLICHACQHDKLRAGDEIESGVTTSVSTRDIEK
jgi:hypothetical protein